MRSTIIAIILLVLVVGFVVINAFVMADITDKIIKLTDESTIYELKEYWDKKSYYISISTHLEVLEEADKSLTDMISYHESGSEEEYIAAEKRFENAIDEIATGEKISFYNIF
jgi:hypothetical protein